MKEKRELLCYILAGGITTIVNYLIYTALLAVSLPYLAANALAWAGAVLAAYQMNRRWVFHSGNHVGKELLNFILLRFLTLLAETMLLWIAVEAVRIHAVPAKLLVSVVTVLSNYMFCKYGIFQKGEV